VHQSREKKKIIFNKNIYQENKDLVFISYLWFRQPHSLLAITPINMIEFDSFMRGQNINITIHNHCTIVEIVYYNL